MKKPVIYLSLLFLPFTSFAQLDYSFDFVSSVDYTYVDNSFTYFSTDISVEAKMNFRVGGNFNVKVFNNAFIKTGLRYAQVGIINKIDNLRWPSENGPNGWEPDPKLPRYFHTTIDQRFFEIPILARYQFGDRKFSFYVEGGISPHIYLTTKYKQVSNIKSEITVFDETSNGSNRFQIVLVFGVGLNYNLSNKYQLFFQPTYRSYPSNDNQFAAPNSFRIIGVEFGIRRGFSFTKTETIII